MVKGNTKKITKTWDASRYTKEAVRAKKSTDTLLSISNKARQILQSGISMNSVQQHLLLHPKDRVYIQVREMLHCCDIQKQKCNTLYPRDVTLPPVHQDLMDFLNNIQSPSNTQHFPKPIDDIELSHKQIGNLLYVLKNPDTCVHVWSSVNYHYYQYNSKKYGVLAVAQNVDNLQEIITLQHYFYQIKKQ
jgi:hypothetical protein